MGEYRQSGNFGEIALMYNSKRSATVLSRGDGVLWSLNRDAYRGIVLKAQHAEKAAYDQALARMPLLADLTASERGRLVDCMTRCTFLDGDKIIAQDDPVRPFGWAALRFGRRAIRELASAW